MYYVISNDVIIIHHLVVVKMLVEVVLLVAALVFLYIASRKPKELPPGVWGLPIIGKLPSGTTRFGDQVKALRPQYGDIITWRVGSRILVFLCNQGVIKRALNRLEMSDRPNFATSTAFSQDALRGVIFSNGKKWQGHRRFVLRQLRDLGMGKTKVEQDIQNEAALLVEDFKKHTGKDEPLPMSLFVAVLNVIWKMVADIRFDVDDERAHKLINSVLKTNEALQGKVTLFNWFPWLKTYGPEWLHRLWGLHQLQNLSNDVHEFAVEAVEEHKKAHDPLDSKDLIDHYISLMDKEEGKDQESMHNVDELCCLAKDLLAAGMETTTSTIRWAILYLAKYPDVQRRVQQEIDSVLPKGTVPHYQDRVKLPYFEAFLSEVHRIVSLAPIGVPHEASEDTTIDGYTIPKDVVHV